MASELPLDDFTVEVLMPACKHYPGITGRQLKNLGDFLETEFTKWTEDDLDALDAMDELKLALVYDPLKEVLKVTLIEKPNGLREAHVWKLLDELLAYSRLAS